MENNNVTSQEIKELLDNQTETILDAVDQRMTGLDNRMIALEKRLDEVEISLKESINELTNTLDAFLKRLTDTETEFAMMKADINRMKQVIKEKLEVEL